MRQGRAPQTRIRFCSLGRALPFILSFWVFLAQGAETRLKIELTPEEFKAKILATLPSYISEWPRGAFADSTNRLILGVLGKENDAFLEALRFLVMTARVDGREVVVREFNDASQLGKCHILFVPAASVPQWSALSKSGSVQGILAVGETEDFAKADMGGAFRMITKDRKLEANPRNAKKAGYRINSKLLRIIRTVD